MIYIIASLLSQKSRTFAFAWVRMTCILLVVFASLATADQPSKPSPNVLFLAIDDLNDWVEPLQGHPLVKTPNFNRLAAQGTTFTNAHCQAPLCNSSRTSLMLSLRPTTTGIYSLEPAFHQIPALKERVPLFEQFKRNGYDVYSVGKLWHGGIPPEQRKREFTELGAAGKLTRPAKPFAVTPSKHPLVDWGPFPERDEQHYDHQTADWAIEKLKTPLKQPFVMAVGFSLPHVPCFAPQPWFNLYPNDNTILPKLQPRDRDDVPPFAWYLHWHLPEPRLKWLREAEQWQPLVRAYLASISFMDAQVGRVLDALEASGQAENTIIVLWSDHGWHLGEKEISGKNTLWERSTRVPLIFAGPGIASQARCQKPAELLDLYPTLVELCQLPPRNDLEGISLVPQLKNAEAERTQPAITSQGPGNHTVRSEEWRYIRYADGSEELYNMRNDPQEWDNLAAQPDHAETIRNLAAHVPKQSAVPVPGSKSRLVELKAGSVYWETELIPAGAAIPD